MKNQPTSIFLDLGFKPDEDTDFNDLTETTWSSDNATESGLEYVSKESVRDEIDGYKSALGDLRAEFKQGNELVKVKSAESELVSLNAFILMNLPSGITEDYDFPSSTSRATIKRIMGIIRESNERFMVRVRQSIAISNAQPK